jgi:hypothetical protein
MSVKETGRICPFQSEHGKQEKEQVFSSWGINSIKIYRKIFIKLTNYVVFIVK